MISCQIQHPVHWKHFATSHGKGVVDGIDGAAKAHVRGKVKSKGQNDTVVQNTCDFASLATTLMPTQC